jgi:hypothetical protein
MFVYLMASSLNGLHKIGISKDPHKRLLSIKWHVPDVRLLDFVLVESERIWEKDLHEQFYKKRVFGEWFRLDDSDLTYILSLFEAKRERLEVAA